MQNFPRYALLGLLIGDALGVPAEFRSRSELKAGPVSGLTGYGTHHQPPGTWSDDGALALCLAEALCAGFDLAAIARRFTDWLYRGHWTPHGEVFDVGIGTRQAIARLEAGVQPDLAGGTGEWSNGNGSLMRILPLLFYLRDKPEPERFELTRQVSALTHAHVRSVLACFYYLEFARLVCTGLGKYAAYRETNLLFQNRLATTAAAQPETAEFARLVQGDLPALGENAIRADGYVIHTLEASLWCVLTSGSYREAVLKAVNLGEDTDTTGAVTGGLAGLVFGLDSVPAEWIRQIARIDEVEALIRVFGRRYAG